MSAPVLSPSRINTCGGCPARWEGSTPCHCSLCHATFLNVDAFEAHRRSTRATRKRTCQDPAALGMIRLPMALPTYWGPAPMGVADRRARRAALLAQDANGGPSADDVKGA